MKTQQRGLSFIGILIMVAIFAFIGLIGAQAVPSVIEYMAVLKATKIAARESTPQQVRAAFDKSAQIDDIKSISAKDLVITPQGDRSKVTFSYNKEIAIAGPAYLLLKFEGSSSK